MIKIKSIKYQWPAQYPGLLLLSLIIGFTGTMALITESIITPMQLLFGIIAGTIALLYNQKIIGIHLRSIKGVKAFSIASVSIIAAVFIPAAKFPITEVNLLLIALYALAQFLFISALCIASDLRDIDEDKEDQIKTFPVAAGAAISKKIISILMCIHLLLLFIIYNLNFMDLHQLEGYLMVSMLTLLFIANLNPSKSYYYFILGIDGLILCQSISILISN